MSRRMSRWLALTCRWVMYARANEFFTSIVRPTVDEFLSRDDIRHGMLAAIVLSHMADYWQCDETGSASSLQEVKRFRDRLTAECNSFSVIHDVADATKHCLLAKSDRQHEIRPGTPGALIGAMAFNMSMFNQSPAPVMVILTDGTAKPLNEAIRAVSAMWERKLKTGP
jgi:hypothetical protein